MTDLTRLRTIIQGCTPATVPLSAVLYHLSPKPTEMMLLDAESVEDAIKWLTEAPIPLMGQVAGGAGIGATQVAQMASTLVDGDYARIATLANSMVARDNEWDRDVRDRVTTAVSTHTRDATLLTAYSSFEFAALDMLSDNGFKGVDDAVARLADMRRAPNCKYHHVSHQLKRSRHCVSVSFTSTTGQTTCAITPWCLSKRNAQAVAALLLREQYKDLIESRTIARAKTVSTFVARMAITDVRRLVRTATSLVTRYRYDSRKLAFVNTDGTVVQSITARDWGTTAAFAYALTRGAADTLLLLAELRVATANEVVDKPGARPLPQAANDYYELAGDVYGGITLFTRALEAYRNEPVNGTRRARTNKGAVLGRPMRERKDQDRNTLACISRLEEVVTLRRHETSLEPLYVVEWGGMVRFSNVIAAAAMMKINIAVDVADSTIDLPGADVYGENEDPLHHYQLYLAEARDLGLPRMPVHQYDACMPLNAKLQVLTRAVNQRKKLSVVYVSGGVQHTKMTPVSICVDTVARVHALATPSVDFDVDFATADILLPPSCPHSLDVAAGDYLENPCVCDSCDQCEAISRALASIGNTLENDNVRLMKPRCLFGHNAHFSVEWFRAPTIDLLSSTMTTIDSAMACNSLRNAHYTSPYPEPTSNEGISNPDLMEMMRDHVQQIHMAMAGGDLERAEPTSMESVAGSI